MRLALFQPDQAGNVGTILRLAACLGVPVDIVEPCGFPYSDRALKRAGMDYAEMAAVRRHASWAELEASLEGRLVLFTTRGSTRLPEARFERGDTLLFGSESRGAPEPVHARADLRLSIPQAAGTRSLNLAVAARIGLAEALRQTGGWPDPGARPAACGPAGVRIRAATAADIGAMHALRLRVAENRLTDPERVTEASYPAFLDQGAAWVAETEQGLAGFAILDVSAAAVWALFVAPEAEGKGIGRALHDRLLEAAVEKGLARLSLTTDPGTRAERFYTETGWTRTGTIRTGELSFEKNPVS